MIYLVALLAVTIVSIFICHNIAIRKGLKPVFWGVMAAIIGPLAIPLVVFAKSRK